MEQQLYAGAVQEYSPTTSEPNTRHGHRGFPNSSSHSSLFVYTKQLLFFKRQRSISRRLPIHGRGTHTQKLLKCQITSDNYHTHPLTEQEIQCVLVQHREVSFPCVIGLPCPQLLATPLLNRVEACGCAVHTHTHQHMHM